MRRSLTVVVGIVAALGLAVPTAGAAPPPSDVNIVVETSFVGPSPFVASGPAVDVGEVCASGSVSDAAGRVVGSGPGFTFVGVKQFVCDDGSGEFSVGLRARIDARGVSFHWNVLDGTGDYTSLHGAGSGVGFGGVPCGDPALCVLDVYDGAMFTT